MSPPSTKNTIPAEEISSLTSLLDSPVLSFPDYRSIADGSSFSPSIHDSIDITANDLDLTNPGASVTYDIYKNLEGGGLTRSRSSSCVPSLAEVKRISSLKEPGGFRRSYIAQQAKIDGRSPPRVVETSFLDYWSLYDHFAGENLSDSDDEEEEEDNEEEEDTPTQSTSDPLIRRSSSRKVAPPGTATLSKTFFLLMKSFVATGVLFLPKAFYNGGLLFSSIVLTLVSIISLISILKLVKVRSIVPGGFGEIGGILYGKWLRYIILSDIALSQMGFTCAYFIFVAKNISDLISAWSNCQIQVSEHLLILLQLLIYIPFSFLRKMKSFSNAALIANVAIMFGLGYIYIVDLDQLFTAGPAEVQMFNSKSFGLFLGTASFTFEGIGLILPIVSSMKEPEKFPRLMTMAMAIIAMIFVSIGALSYATFGEKTQAVILLNLPESPATQLTQVLYVLAIILTVPLMMFPAVRIIEQATFGRKTGKYSTKIKTGKNVLRASLCALASAIAYAGSSNLDNFVALIGAFACIPLAFIFPALFHLKAVASHPLSKLGDITLIFFGLCTMVFVTINTLATWSTTPEGNRCTPGIP
ncbi:hypothetical protein K7432_001108 [Basidiobolus ranarum]|uniref:Amino acid transporter transmembrane domain-containing protein n=1 Tax=Basidiobolus ranarum TaxID=34480 RepID=A0ABR2WA65_9FUNG